MLLTKENRKALPALYSTDSTPEGEKMAVVKLFDPCGRFTLYVVEFDQADTLFGYTISPLGPDCDEYGYASLSELASVKNRLGLGIERDRHFTPKPMTAVLAERGKAAA